MTTAAIVALWVSGILAGLLVFDHFVKEIPPIRKFRNALVVALGLAAFALAFALGKGRQPEGSDEPEFEPMPEDLNDDEFHETDTAADNLDVDAGSTNADIDSVSDSTDDRDDKLDSLSSELDAL